MAEIIMDKWLSFVVENHRDIDSIVEIYKHAKNLLPEQVNRLLNDGILELHHFFQQHKLRCKPEEGELRWYDPSVFDGYYGAYCCYESDVNWEWLTNAGEDAARLAVYLEPKGSNKVARKLDLNTWRDLFAESAERLAPRGIRLNPDSDDELYLAAYSLQKEISIDLLKIPESLCKGVQEAVKEFTLAVLPIFEAKKRL